MKPLLAACALVLLAACGSPEPPPAPAPPQPALVDTAEVRRQAIACADAWIATHGGPPTTLREFGQIQGPCQAYLFGRLDPATQSALWTEQLDYYARSEEMNDLQRAALVNLRNMLSESYFAMPAEERPEPTTEELARLFGHARMADIFFRLGSMYAPEAD